MSKHKITIADLKGRIQTSQAQAANCDQVIIGSLQEIAEATRGKLRAEARIEELTATLAVLEGDNA